MQTETIQITLPVETVEWLRERVRNGEYLSESEAVLESLHRTLEVDVWADLPDEPFQGAFESYLRDEVTPRIRSIQDGTAKLYTIEEVRTHMALRTAEPKARQ